MALIHRYFQWYRGEKGIHDFDDCQSNGGYNQQLFNHNKTQQSAKRIHNCQPLSVCIWKKILSHCPQSCSITSNNARLSGFTAMATSFSKSFISLACIVYSPMHSLPAAVLMQRYPLSHGCCRHSSAVENNKK